MLEAIRKVLTRTDTASDAEGGSRPEHRATPDPLPECWRPLAELSQCGLFVRSSGGGLLYANGVLAEMLGYAPGEMTGLRWHELVLADEAKPPLAGVSESALRMRMKGGQGVRHVVMRSRAVTAAGEPLRIGSIVDVTEQQRGESALRDYARRLQLLSRQIIEVQENERCNLARELHDEIGQQLTLVKLSLEALRGDGADPVLDDALESVTRLTQQVRDLSLDLRPSMLDDLGLVAALRWYLYRAARVAEIGAGLDVGDAFPRMHTPVETLFFRVGQEAITNALRHSGATHLDLRLVAMNGSVLMEVSDDGRGFDPVAAQSSALAGCSAGLLGMQERAALAGATLEIESAPGAGSRLRLMIDAERAGIGSKTG